MAKAKAVWQYHWQAIRSRIFVDKTICVLGVTTRDPKLQGVKLDESSVILGDIGICARR